VNLLYGPMEMGVQMVQAPKDDYSVEAGIGEAGVQ
jgi:hypothetical protein